MSRKLLKTVPFVHFHMVSLTKKYYIVRLKIVMCYVKSEFYFFVSGEGLDMYSIHLFLPPPPPGLDSIKYTWIM